MTCGRQTTGISMADSSQTSLVLDRRPRRNGRFGWLGRDTNQKLESDCAGQLAPPLTALPGFPTHTSQPRWKPKWHVCPCPWSSSKDQSDLYYGVCMLYYRKIAFTQETFTQQEMRIRNKSTKMKKSIDWSYQAFSTRNNSEDLVCSRREYLCFAEGKGHIL